MNPKELLDPEIAACVEQAPPQRTWDPAWMRARVDEALADPLPLPEGVNLDVCEAAGREVRVLRPDAEPRRLVLSIHGGGFVSGHARYDDGWNAEIALAADAVVVSPEYRRPPEDPYPAALDDCRAAWEWAVGRWPGLSGTIYGDSAGGNLAAGLTLWLRDHGCVVPDRLFLIEPVLDHRLSTDSMRTGVDTPIWDLPNARASWRAYVGGRAAVDCYASPALAADLSGLPPTFIVANQCDPLRDEDIAFARALTDANVEAQLVLFPRTCHGFLGLEGPRVSERGRAMVLRALDSDVCEWL